MRQGKWVLAVMFGLLLATPAWAQRTANLGGVDPTRLEFRPINTDNSVVPIARTQTLEHATFSLKNILPRPGLPSAKPVIGRSEFPTQAGMPGMNYLKAFHFERPQGVR